MSIDKQLTEGEVREARALAKQSLQSHSVPTNGNPDVETLASKYVNATNTVVKDGERIKAELQKSKDDNGPFRGLANLVTGRIFEGVSVGHNAIILTECMDNMTPADKDKFVKETLAEFSQAAVLNDLADPSANKLAPSGKAPSDEAIKR